MNLSMLLTRTAWLFPDKPAFIHGDRQLTYAQFMPGLIGWPTRFDSWVSKVDILVNNVGIAEVGGSVEHTDGSGTFEKYLC